MNFNEFPYVRPDMEAVQARFAKLLESFENAESFPEQDRILEEIQGARGEFESMQRLASIRHTINTTDEFYAREKDYFNEAGPVYQGLVTDYFRKLAESRFRGELESKWGKQLFRLAELSLKTFSQEVLEDLQIENKTVSEYVKLLASAKILFQGEERNLPQLVPFQLSTDREIRKQAMDAKYGFFRENEEKLDEIYDRLVKLRTQIARKLGFSSFTELAYARLDRTDYGPEQVAKFRAQVKERIVPAAGRLKERQRKRLGLETLTYYDDKFTFLSGNAAPKGDAEWILERGRRMYNELSPETDEFFSFMTDKGLLDLLSKPGKATGGYCNYISQFRSPFIFANFNGTSGDIDVLTHEAGHAFQVYTSRDYGVPEYHFPTLEACEIHSMSMEFLTWPWMELFFEGDTDKYKYSHLSGSLLFIPYGVAVDEFQHYVYANPEATPAERKLAWREIEKAYLPHLDYRENDYLERGGFWYQQAHIFKTPFYYIDYTLAQVCAFQFWVKAEEDRDAAWSDYVGLCKLGGSKPFTELVASAGLISPFENGCVDSVVGTIEAWLDGVDDTLL